MIFTVPLITAKNGFYVVIRTRKLGVYANCHAYDF